MLVERYSQQSVRRLFIQRPSTFAFHKAVIPSSSLAIRLPTAAQSRPAATIHQPESPGSSILTKQRLNRPVSPHLTIYKPQITWYLSALNRVTGSILSGGFYIFGSAYLFAPLFGWHLEAGTLAAAFGALPVAVKFLVKYLVSLPFTFHSFNGIRHLMWDTGREFGNKQVIRTGWAVVGLTFLGSGVLAFM